ncbi:MAG: RIP metalloprotease RseP [Salinarimonadaceae bacterium]|nr:MAG: RIP metalloprotease RseP [Salinarimonadaceae bacterium]
MEIFGVMVGSTYDLLVVYLPPFLLVLAVVIFVHEMGHFLVGRWCGVGVQVFSIGFGPELLGWTDKRGTRWKVCVIPLGGYVKFAGDLNVTSTPDTEELARMSETERSESFHHKSVGQRAAIVAAGPAANFLMAIAIFAGLAYFNGKQVLEPRVQAVIEGSAAESAGFQPGDLVLAIDGRAIDGFSDLQRLVSSSAGDTLAFTVERDGAQVTLVATPIRTEQETPFGRHRVGLLGLQAANDADAIRTIRYGPVEALGQGVYETYFVIERTLDYLGKLVTGRESADQLSGPIRIAQVSGDVANYSGLIGLISLTALLSVSIGFINLFPIPMLDGGHLMFYAVEAVRGRPLSDEAQEIGFRIGLALMLMLMLFVTWNDIVNLTA